MCRHIDENQLASSELSIPIYSLSAVYVSIVFMLKGNSLQTYEINLNLNPFSYCIKIRFNNDC